MPKTTYEIGKFYENNKSEEDAIQQKWHSEQEVKELILNAQKSTTPKKAGHN